MLSPEKEHLLGLSSEMEYYIRFYILLSKGGTALLRGLAEKALTKLNKSFGDLLQTHETNIKADKQVTQDQKLVLYPGTAQGAHIDDLDISLLAHLILKYLRQYLTPAEKKTVKEIRTIRNIYSHSAEACMKLSVFTHERQRLIDLIRSGYTNLPHDLQKRLDEVITTSADDPLDRATVERIGQESGTSVHQLLKNIQTGQQQLVTDQASGFLDITRQMQEMTIILQYLARQGEVEKTVKTISFYVHLRGRDEDSVDRAERILLERLEQHLNSSGEENLSQDDLQRSVQKFLTEINHLNVTVVKVERLSIMLTFTCISLEGILAFLEYLDSPDCELSLGKLAQNLETFTGVRTDITAFIDILSLKTVVSKLYIQYTQAITRTTVGCSNENCPGVCALCRRTDRLAEKLEVEAQEIDVHPSTDLSVTSSGSNMLHGNPEQSCRNCEKVIRFEMKSSGPEGLLHLLEVSEGGKADKSLKELSTALSSAVNAPVTIHTSVDAMEMKNAIRSIQEQQSDVKQTQIEEEGSRLPINFTKSARKKSKEVFLPKGKTDILLELKYEKDICKPIMHKNIFHCVALSKDRLLTSDKHSTKVLDLCVRQTEKTLFKDTISIAQLPGDHVAILTKKRHLNIYKVADDISKVFTIELSELYCSIAYSQDHLYCYSKDRVDVLDMQGKITRSTKLSYEQHAHLPLVSCKSAVSKDGTKMYLTNQSSMSVNLLYLPLTDKTVTRTKSKHIPEPTGLVVLEDDNLLVCSKTGNIYSFSADLQQAYSLITIQTKGLLSMCYQPATKSVFVGGKKRQIHVIRLHKIDRIPESVEATHHQAEKTKTDEYPLTSVSAFQQIPGTSSKEMEYTTISSFSMPDQIGTKEVSCGAITPGCRRGINLMEISRKRKINLGFVRHAPMKTTGLAALSGGRILLASYHTRKLKVKFPDSQIYTGHKKLTGHPLGIAVLPADKVAVILELDNLYNSSHVLFAPAQLNRKLEIQILDSKEKLVMIQRIPVQEEYTHIAYSLDHLYLVYKKSKVTIDILDMQGRVLTKIPINVTGDFLTGITVKKGGKKIFVCGYKEDTVASVTLGEVVTTYHHRDMRGPRALIELEDGSLLATCSWFGTIHCISNDLKQGYTVARNLPGVWSICYQPSMKKVFVGSMAWKSIRTYSVEGLADETESRTEFKSGQRRQLKKGDTADSDFRYSAEQSHKTQTEKHELDAKDEPSARFSSSCRIETITDRRYQRETLSILVVLPDESEEVSYC